MAAVRRSDAATAYTVQLTRVGIETHWIHNFRELQVTQRQSPCVTLAKLSSPRERVLIRVSKQLGGSRLSLLGVYWASRRLLIGQVIGDTLLCTCGCGLCDRNMPLPPAHSSALDWCGGNDRRAGKSTAERGNRPGNRNEFTACIAFNSQPKVVIHSAAPR